VKVLHIAESGFGGGAESVFRDTIVALNKFDNNTHLVACRYHANLPFSIDLTFQNTTENNFLINLFQIYNHKNYLTLSSFLNKERPQIIHLHNYGNLSPSILRALINYKQKDRDLKIIHSVHTFEYLCSHHAGYDYKKQKRCLDCAKNKIKTKIFYRHCSRAGIFHSIGKGITSILAQYYLSFDLIDIWITPSVFLKNEMSKSWVAKDKIYSIINPLPDIFLNQAKNQIEKDPENSLIYFGRISNEKNLDVLLKAVSLLIKENFQVNLKIVGSGIERERLLLLSETYGISNFVHFIPFIEQTELLKILLKTKVSILPSKCFETASMLVLESISSNVFPIVVNHGGMLEMINYMNVGYTFEDNDHHDLCDKIKSAFVNYSINLRKVNAAKLNLKELGLSNYSLVITEMYNKLLNIE
jgi:glycosyltransferase involved in cell wall biosynthesis